MAMLPQRALERIIEAETSGRLAHAYLLCGPRGSGKGEIVAKVSAHLLRVDDARRHPDFHHAEPESKSRRILIEQIRRLEQALRAKPVVGPRKVAVIREADRLQPQAANAFLKTLEEPPAGSHVFLTAPSPESLLETIVSRCIVVQLQPSAPLPTTGVALELVSALEGVLANPASPVRAAFTLSRTFLDVLARERERIRDEAAEALKAEQAHYGKTTDGAWLEEREEQLKASAEAAVVRLRGELVQVLVAWFADALRVQHGTAPAQDRPALRTYAQSADVRLTLRRVHALEELAANLNTNIQEALAVESGFLKLFSIPS